MVPVILHVLVEAAELPEPDIEISGGVVRLIQENTGYLLGGSRSYGTTEGICISGGEVTGTIEYQGDPFYNFLAKISEESH